MSLPGPFELLILSMLALPMLSIPVIGIAVVLFAIRSKAKQDDVDSQK